MYTTKTKMLFNQLPGSVVFDQDSQQWTTPMQWTSEPFKPPGGAKNVLYLLDRALGLVKQHPAYLREGYSDCNVRDFDLLQPWDTKLSIIPRIFICHRCDRISSFRVPDNPENRDRFFASGYKCRNCGQHPRFKQMSLVYVHQCGHLSQPFIRKCDQHEYKHLFLDRRGTQQPTEYRIRCMGEGGNSKAPKCAYEARLLPSGHSTESCDVPKAIRANQQFANDLMATQIADELENINVRIRASQDPANFYAIGLDVVNPSIEIPEGIREQEETLEALLTALIEGNPLGSKALQEAFQKTAQESERTKAIRGLVAAFESQETQGLLSQGGEGLAGSIWKIQVQSLVGFKGKLPATYDSAKEELRQVKKAAGKAAEIISNRGARDDRSQIVDQLIEVTHLVGEVSAFESMDQTRASLAEHERESSPSFALATDTARRMGFEDIQVSDAFEIVRLQVGFVRNTYDASRAVLSPFREKSHSRRPIYARQSNTEAVMFKVNPTKLAQWVHAQWPANEYVRIANPGKLTDPEARRWLLEAVDYRQCQSYDPILHQPTRQVFQLLHTMSHLAMRTSSKFSGLDASTVKELIFPALPGFVIYKSQHGDINLGGMLSLYEDHLGDWLAEIGRAARECPNDPICRNARMRDTTKAAACYGCLAGSELSCAHFNRDLDRAVLTGTVPQRRDSNFRGFWDAIA